MLIVFSFINPPTSLQM